MSDKFCVTVVRSAFVDSEDWSSYFLNFYKHSLNIAYDNGWQSSTVMNYQLKPHGKLIQTSTQGWYLRWDDEKYHTHFVLKWS